MSSSVHASAAPAARLGARPRLLDRYREFLPVTDKTPIISLGEGNTPLVHVEHIGKRIPSGDLGKARRRQRIEADVEAIDPGSAQAGCHRRQAGAVGRQRQITKTGVPPSSRVRATIFFRFDL